MCGIAGILSDTGGAELQAPLDALCHALRHRGPDDEGTAQVALPAGRWLGLAHTRLAIQDLGRTARQPMSDPASGSWIVYNGEIYNHRELRRRLGNIAFRSSGDTETLLQCWVQFGRQTLDWLRGMFAFALYDGRRQELWLVRDRLGVKPLYLTQLGPGRWLFASEVRALLTSGLVPRRLDAAALDSYLAFGSVIAPRTLVREVRSLLPGECLRFDLAAGRPPVSERYWQPPFAAAVETAAARSTALERLRPILREAVSLRMLADVPVGVFLSGGIDSSSVVATLTAQGFPLHTFSVAFDEVPFDESEHARTIAAHFGTKHEELRLTGSRVIADLERAVAAYDQPSVDGLNTYFLAQAVRQAGLKVALSGLGGDELFAGYPHFRRIARLQRPLVRRSARLLHLMMRGVAPHHPRTAKLGTALDARLPAFQRYATYRQVLSSERRRQLYPAARPAHELLPPQVARELEAAAARLDPVNAHSLMELTVYLANTLLRDSDQMSMAHGLELREPLLDHQLVETVADLPGSLKLQASRAGRAKGLLLDALPAPLPPSVIRRRKMGFVLPWDRWLKRELRERVGAVLTDSSLCAAAGLDAAAVHQLWQEFLAGRSASRSAHVISLSHLLFWIRLHGMRQ